MFKATLRQGEIVQLEPIPSDWMEGTQTEIDIALGEKFVPTLDIEEWVRAMDALCAESAEYDERTVQQAIGRLQEYAKAQAHCEMNCRDDRP